MNPLRKQVRLYGDQKIRYPAGQFTMPDGSPSPEMEVMRQSGEWLTVGTNLDLSLNPHLAGAVQTGDI